jgi:hypothetical protein
MWGTLVPYHKPPGGGVWKLPCSSPRLVVITVGSCGGHSWEWLWSCACQLHRRVGRVLSAGAELYFVMGFSHCAGTLSTGLGVCCTADGWFAAFGQLGSSADMFSVRCVRQPEHLIVGMHTQHHRPGGGCHLLAVLNFCWPNNLAKHVALLVLCDCSQGVVLPKVRPKYTTLFGRRKQREGMALLLRRVVLQLLGAT